MPAFHLTDSVAFTVANALRTAATCYEQDAKNCKAHGDERLAEQMTRQAAEATRLAIVFEGGES